MTDSEQEFIETIPEVVPAEGETYMAAYERMMKERAGIAEPDEAEPPAEPLGVLTGQVPVRSMPIAMGAPEGIKGENLPKQPLDGEVTSD